MSGHRVPADALVLIGDGRKAIFLRNNGTTQDPNLIVERVIEQHNPPTREQGVDQPGRYYDAGPNQRSAMEQTDWHELAEERFAVDLAEALYKAALAGLYDKLVVVAPPNALGDLRKAFHKEVSSRVVVEIAKDLTNHPVDEIEKNLSSKD